MHYRFARWPSRIPHNRLPCVCPSNTWILYIGNVLISSLIVHIPHRRRQIIDVSGASRGQAAGFAGADPEIAPPSVTVT